MNSGSIISPLLLAVALGSAGCQDHLEPCEIGSRACQEDVYYGVLRVRQDGYDPFGGLPPVRSLTPDQLRAELQAWYDQAPAEQPSSDSRDAWNVALSLLGLVAPGPGGTTDALIDNFVETTAAYYDSATKEITVIDRTAITGRAAADVAGDMETLAHELVHALQDRELGFERAADVESSDELFAAKAVTEGDAVLYELLFALDNPRVYPELARFDADAIGPFLRTWGDGFLEDVADSPVPFDAAQDLVYPFGAAYLAARWSEGGNAAVRRAYGSMPVRSVDYLAGRPGPAERKVACLPSLPPGFDSQSLLGRDVFGAVGFLAYLAAWKVEPQRALDLALTWANDRVLVYRNAAKQTAVVWRIELSRDLPEDILSTLTTTDGPRIEAGGRAVLITAADGPEVMATWEASVTCSTR